MGDSKFIYTVWHNGRKITEGHDYPEVFQRGLGAACFVGIEEEWTNTRGGDVLDRWETSETVICVTKHPAGQGVEYTSVEVVNREGYTGEDVPALDYVGSGKIKVAIDWGTGKYVHQSTKF